jgi:hypothetical protein
LIAVAVCVPQHAVATTGLVAVIHCSVEVSFAVILAEENPRKDEYSIRLLAWFSIRLN